VVITLSVLALVSLCFRSGAQSRWTQTLLASATAVVALFMLTSVGPTAFWRHSQIGVGRLKLYEVTPSYLRDAIQTIRRQTISDVDGVESSIGIQNGNGVSFIVNGKSDGNTRGDAGTQVMSGLIGAAIHPNPKQALVVGLGTGCTAG